MVTLNGTTGTLICNHGMGITALDIFSDILTDERDLHNFLEQQVDLEINTKLATTLTGLSIQGINLSNIPFQILFISLFDVRQKDW